MTILANSGELVPLIPDYSYSEGLGITNPSVYNDNGKLLVTLRRVNYGLYHCHNFFQEYGPLQYIHEEHHRVLETVNFVAELRDNLSIDKVHKVDTRQLDETPQWEFIGLEDARLVRWDGYLLLIGVRRDTTPNGQGRMEISALDSSFVEVSRERIPAPGDDTSYCEKNWMPIVDQPYEFIKWTNPTEIASYNRIGFTDSRITQHTFTSFKRDLRGSSHVIPFDGGYLCITHEVAFFHSELGQKDAIYRHRFVYWNKDFSKAEFSTMFSFTGAKIEFCCGMTEWDNDLLISFGRQDSAAFLLRLDKATVRKLLWN